MANRFVRQSKFKHVFPQPFKKNACYENLKVTTNAWDSNLIKVNPKFMAVNWKAGGGGSFAVLDLKGVGRVAERMPQFVGHSAAVLDTDFSPFNDHLIASCSEDSNIMLWSIPENGPISNISDPLVKLSNHSKKVGQVLWHPSAEHVLASTSADLTLRLWDVEKGQQKQEILGHSEVPHSFCWNWEGDKIASTCRDKTIRIFDPRANRVVISAEGHAGVKGSRVCWLGTTNYIATTGFSKSCDRQVNIWDTRSLATSVKSTSLDTSAGVLMPFYDADTNLLFLAGKGDGNIRYFEFVPDDATLYALSEHKSSDPQRGMAFIPKRAVNTNECEVARAYKVTTNMVEPISFIVPRKSDSFQADIYNDCPGPYPAISADQYFAGQTSGPKLISMTNGFVEGPRKEFVAQCSTSSAIPSSQSSQGFHPSQQQQQQSRSRAASTAKNQSFVQQHQVSQTADRDYKELYNELLLEVSKLRAEIAQKDSRIRELEHKN